MRNRLSQWLDQLRIWPIPYLKNAIRPKWEVTIYFDGPRSQWEQQPAAAEILAVRRFRTRTCATVWAATRMHQLAQLAAVVKPL